MEINPEFEQQRVMMKYYEKKFGSLNLKFNDFFFHLTLCVKNTFSGGKELILLERNDWANEFTEKLPFCNNGYL